MKTQKFALLLFVLVTTTKKCRAQDERPVAITDAWEKQAKASLQELEYGFREKQGCFTAVNKKNDLLFKLGEVGYTVQDSRHGMNGWMARFEVKGLGRDGIIAPAHKMYPVKKGSELCFSSAALTVQYINGPEGLRQNFIVRSKPAGNGRLTAGIQLHTTLLVKKIGNDGLQFFSKDNEKDIKLLYDGLKVWDAAGKTLTASIDYQPESQLVFINVEDDQALYPVTIDPLNRTPEWTTSADGILPGLLTNLQLQVQTLYGYTVAGLGDVNGDGYDDVAISAPSMADVISGTGNLTGVGAVFIYLGSPTGLPVTPSKVLQPTTAVSGALFGFSVDAGDITGDGKNDIIIGAPMDRYQTTASGIAGPVSVEVTAGKVYLYRSEDLFNSGNPSPFLQIRLQGTGFFSTGILGLLQSNINTTPLFGYAIAVSKDLNGDAKADILIGAPTYLGVELLSVQSGAAFVYYSDNLSTISPTKLQPPTPSMLGIINLPLANSSGLLFGHSIDCAGDYNNDGNQDVVVGAPAGIDLSGLGGIFSGQFLGGSAFLYFGNGSTVNSTSTLRLQADPAGLLSSTANLFGYKVKGAVNGFGGKTGNILIGAPNGAVLSNIVGGLRVKAGQVHVFKKKPGSVSGAFVSDQVISSPRTSSILSILAGQTINLSLLYGSTIDNMLDINCDNIGDMIVGEPLSTAVPLIGANVVGGSAYVYLGNADGTYQPAPLWDLSVQVSPLLGVNATALLGYSVAGAGYVKGRSQGVRALVGGPANTLDFGIGLLNLGNTLGTTLDFVFDDNGLGKAYVFPFPSCNIALPATLIDFSAVPDNHTVRLRWTSVHEDNFNHYELERSADASQFETIALALAKGDDRNDYVYTDRTPFKDANYYRLKMVDRDSSFSYSPIVRIRFTGDAPAGSLVIAPNPARASIQIRLSGMEKGAYRMELVNASGLTLLTKTVVISQYCQSEIINRTAAMSNGFYLIRLTDSHHKQVYTGRIVLH